MKPVNVSMKVITVNIPKAYLKYIDIICDKENSNEDLGFEPSRSEFVRHAIKDKIIMDLKLSRAFHILEHEERGMEKHLTVVVPPKGQKPRTIRVPLGNKYYIKGMNEA